MPGFVEHMLKFGRLPDEIVVPELAARGVDMTAIDQRPDDDLVSADIAINRQRAILLTNEGFRQTEQARRDAEAKTVEDKLIAKTKSEEAKQIKIAAKEKKELEKVEKVSMFQCIVLTKTTRMSVAYFSISFPYQAGCAGASAQTPQGIELVLRQFLVRQVRIGG